MESVVARGNYGRTVFLEKDILSCILLVITASGTLHVHVCNTNGLKKQSFIYLQSFQRLGVWCRSWSNEVGMHGVRISKHIHPPPGHGGFPLCTGKKDRKWDTSGSLQRSFLGMWGKVENMGMELLPCRIPIVHLIYSSVAQNPP